MKTLRIEQLTRNTFGFVPSARLGKVDVDSSSFTSQELKKALAKMKASEKAEQKVRRVPCF